jgi:pteridine reductase
LDRDFARLDVLVNNASIFPKTPLEHTEPELIRRLMAIHYESPLLAARRFAPMLKAARGSIINMLDIAVERPMRGYAAYTASKSALWNLTLSLARELAPEVTVNGIAPGVVEWPDDYAQADRDKYLSRVPLARSGTPQDVASLVRFLVTEGRYITGQIIRVDGGRSIV